jgi:hypothetical protein
MHGVHIFRQFRLLLKGREAKGSGKAMKRLSHCAMPSLSVRVYKPVEAYGEVLAYMWECARECCLMVLTLSLQALRFELQ